MHYCFVGHIIVFLYVLLFYFPLLFVEGKIKQMVLILEMELKIELILILFLTPTKIARNAPVSNIN